MEMVLFGKNIQSTTEPLREVSVENIYRAILNPKPETVALIRQLRVVRQLDVKQYNSLKRQLPFIVCGIFNPTFRRTENFAYTEYFILDIDKLSSKGVSLDNLRTEICKDDRVLLCFASPSEDGLKVMFRLKERCCDAGIYQVFYKLFAKQFAIQYHLEQVVDGCTSDVTRACFVSYDPQAYYNPNATQVDVTSYVSQDDPTAFFDLKRELFLEEKKQQQEIKKELETQKKDDGENNNNQKPDVDEEVIANIKAILEPFSKKKVSKPPVCVPEQLNEVIDELKKYIEQTGLVVTEIINISYAKKIRVRSQYRQAEVNLFYGKRGFSVVKSPRSGTDPELNEMLANLISSFLNS